MRFPVKLVVAGLRMFRGRRKAVIGLDAYLDDIDSTLIGGI
jgi:hypothetical protein